MITTCPKCAHVRRPSDSRIHEGVCPACGIAYQKYIDRQRGLEKRPVLVEMTVVPGKGEWLRERLMEAPERVDPTAFWARAALWCVAALWGLYFTWHGIDWEVLGGSFMHNVILPFHEFGHILFMPFGRFMSILGGSLFQVLMPLGLAIAFIWKQRDNFAASIMVWWAGQSLLDLSVYIADARERALPLVGGGGEDSHDWGNLLTMLGLLDNTMLIARLCFGLG